MVNYKPGSKVPRSGQYEVVGPRGEKTGHEVTAVKEEHFPPTPKPGMTYKPSDYTKHKSGK